MLQPELVLQGSLAHELGRLVRGLSVMGTQGRWRRVHLEDRGEQDREVGQEGRRKQLTVF